MTCLVGPDPTIRTRSLIHYPLLDVVASIFAIDSHEGVRKTEQFYQKYSECPDIVGFGII